MAFATLNGEPLISATIGLPRVGAWHADVAFAGATAAKGRCTLAIQGGLKLEGTVRRSDVWLDTVKVRLVAGADGLGRAAKPQHYRQTRLSTVLGDLLRTAGETLASDAAPAPLALTFASWATFSLPIGTMVGALLSDERLPAMAWRMKVDGTLWLGPESWPDCGLANLLDYQELNERAADGVLELGVEAPSLLPGTVLDGRRVSYVEHVLSGEGARTRAWID